MKGPEEREQTSSCSPEWLVEKSRQALESGDQFSAKSWLLAAKTLHPRSFLVQYEAFQMERRCGKLISCGQIFLEMIKSFPREELLWKELKQIVKSLELNSTELDSESQFLKDMCESLSVKHQRELLLKYADHQTDLVERCRISLVVMKKFHGGTKQYGLKLTELLMEAEQAEKIVSPLNVYRKLLVCAVIPFVLTSPEIHLEMGLKHKTNSVYIAELNVLKWLQLSMEYFMTCGIEQSTLKHNHLKTISYTKERNVENEMVMMNSSWQMLYDQLLLFASKCGWYNILKIKEKIDPEKNKSVKSRWKILNNLKEYSSSWGVFFYTLELFLFALIEYCSQMTTIIKGQRDYQNLETLLLNNFDPSDVAGQSQYVPASRTPKKKRKLGDSSAIHSTPDTQGSIDECLTSQTNSTIDYLQVAIDCKKNIESNSVFSEEFERILKDWRVESWGWMEIFETDSLIYQRKYKELIDLLRKKQSMIKSNNIADRMRTAKQYTQLSMCSFCLGEKKEACEMAFNAVDAISNPAAIEVHFNTESPASTTKNAVDGRCFQLLPCSQKNIMAFCIDILIRCLKEKLSIVDIRPDHDKIGPFYDIRQDKIIGHLIVLLQYDWPKEEALFEQLVKTIITLGGLKYEKFFDYVINIDILEEFSYLNNLEKIQLELQGTNTGEQSRKTVTRGVNRENKEDFRTAMHSQLERCDEKMENLILKFLQVEQQSLLAHG